MKVISCESRGRTALVLASLAVFASLSSRAVADSSLSNDSSLGDVTVTATRTATPVADALASTTVLTQRDIESRQVLSLQELFEGEAGLEISNNGGLGKATSVFVRGANANQVLVLVDGVRMGTATVGVTSFQYLPVDQIERVEIVRGPLSSLYGSEAMGGVIQIFTRRPTAEGISVEANAAAGSHDTYAAGAGVNAVSGPWSFGISGSNLTSTGYRSCTGAPATAASAGGGCYVDDPSPDGYHDVADSAHLSYRFSDSADVDATFLRAQGGTRYAGSYTNHETFVQQAAALAGHWSPVTALRITAELGQSHDNELDTLDLVEPPGNLFDTTRSSASLQADWTLAPHRILTLGADYLHDAIATDAGFAVTSRRVTGEFGEYQGTFGSAQITLSGRHDDNSQFGSKNTGNLAAAYRLSPTLRLIASYGSAFHAPSFNDLYYPGYGNPDLKPETSRSYEVGVEQHLDIAHWSARGFDTRIHDLIEYDGVLFAPENTATAHIRGVELETGVALSAWTGDLTASWLDARNITADSAQYGAQLPRRPRATSRLEIARGWQTVRAAGRLNVAGPSFDDVDNTARLGGYTTLDALLEWRPARQWTLQAKIGNVTDHRYQTALYYPQDRRNFLVTLRYRTAAP